MTPQIDTMFTTSLYHNKLDFDLKDFCHNIQKFHSQNNRSGVNSWQSENIIETLPENFLKALNNEIYQYSKFLKVKRKLVLDMVWLNVNKKGSYNLEHDHPNSFVAGVYYISVPKNSGNIVFKHPSITMNYCWPDKDCFNEYNEFNGGQEIINSENNQLLLFPSWLKHRVEENKSDEDRISLSFNCNLSY